MAKLPLKAAWIDGEIVMPGDDGRTSFQAPAERALRERRALARLFRLRPVYLDGFDLRMCLCSSANDCSSR